MPELDCAECYHTECSCDCATCERTRELAAAGKLTACMCYACRATRATSDAERLALLDAELARRPLRPPPQNGPKIASGAELDWSAALKAANAIVHNCEAAHFAPPEALSMHMQRVGFVCEAMNAIADALRLRNSGR